MAIPKPQPKAAQADSPAPVTRKPATSNSHPSTGPVKFVRATATKNRRVIISVCGEEKSGKNYMGFTFPEPIYVHSFDIGLEGTIDQFVKKKEIYVAEYELEIQPGEASVGEVAESASKLWDNFVANYKDSIVSAKDGTVICDTDTEIYELLRLSRFGKLTQVMPHHYGPVNAEFRDIVRTAYDHKCNLFLIGRMGDEWLNDASGKGNKTGVRIRKGFGDLEYLTQVNAMCKREDIPGGGSNFSCVIDSCRQNAECNGAEIPNDFESLSLAVFGE